MPCVTHPRGFTDANVAWDDVIDNDPCAKKALTSVGGVDVTAESLCRFHWQLAHGIYALKGAIVTEP